MEASEATRNGLTPVSFAGPGTWATGSVDESRAPVSCFAQARGQGIHHCQDGRAGSLLGGWQVRNGLGACQTSEQRCHVAAVQTYLRFRAEVWVRHINLLVKMIIIPLSWQIPLPPLVITTRPGQLTMNPTGSPVEFLPWPRQPRRLPLVRNSSMSVQLQFSGTGLSFHPHHCFSIVSPH